MAGLPPTSALREFPQLHRLAMLSPSNQSLVADYLANMQARHFAAASLEGVMRALKSFAVLTPASRQAVLYEDLSQTTPADIDAWIDASFQSGLAASTVDTRLRCLRGFFTFLQGQGHMTRSPIHDRRHQIMVPQGLPRPMPEEALVAFFHVIDSLRDRTLFLLMLRCGLRVSETSGLAWSTIDLERGAIRIDTSKGQVDRVVYIAPDLDAALRQWRGLQDPESHYVFPSPFQRKHGQPITARQIRVLMTKYLKAAQIPPLYSPHSLRHTFATQLLNAGASLETVKELMGHRHLEMTLRYAQLYDHTKRAQYDAAMAQVEGRQQL